MYITHYIPVDSRSGVCGTLADPERQHSVEPTCHECCTILADEDRQRTQLQQWSAAMDRAVFTPRVPVTSGNIVSVGFDAALQVLLVEFRHGGIYQFRDVPQAVYDAFLSAQSKGQYFHRAVRGKYASHMVMAPPMGTCAACGDRGVVGLQCGDCGCADYTSGQ